MTILTSDIGHAELCNCDHPENMQQKYLEDAISFGPCGLILNISRKGQIIQFYILKSTVWHFFKMFDCKTLFKGPTLTFRQYTYAIELNIHCHLMYITSRDGSSWCSWQISSVATPPNLSWGCSCHKSLVTLSHMSWHNCHVTADVTHTAIIHLPTRTQQWQAGRRHKP